MAASAADLHGVNAGHLNRSLRPPARRRRRPSPSPSRRRPRRLAVARAQAAARAQARARGPRRSASARCLTCPARRATRQRRCGGALLALEADSWGGWAASGCCRADSEGCSGAAIYCLLTAACKRDAQPCRRCRAAAAGRWPHSSCCRRPPRPARPLRPADRPAAPLLHHAQGAAARQRDGHQVRGAAAQGAMAAGCRALTTSSACPPAPCSPRRAAQVVRAARPAVAGGGGAVGAGPGAGGWLGQQQGVWGRWVLALPAVVLGAAGVQHCCGAGAARRRPPTGRTCLMAPSAILPLKPCPAPSCPSRCRRSAGARRPPRRPPPPSAAPPAAARRRPRAAPSARRRRRPATARTRATSRPSRSGRAARRAARRRRPPRSGQVRGGVGGQPRWGRPGSLPGRVLTAAARLRLARPTMRVPHPSLPPQLAEPPPLPLPASSTTPPAAKAAAAGSDSEEEFKSEGKAAKPAAKPAAAAKKATPGSGGKPAPARDVAFADGGMGARAGAARAWAACPCSLHCCRCCCRSCCCRRCCRRRCWSSRLRSPVATAERCPTRPPQSYPARADEGSSSSDDDVPLLARKQQVAAA